MTTTTGVATRGRTAGSAAELYRRCADEFGAVVAQIDSLRMFMVMNLGAYTGDSIAPMGLGVYRLTDELETPIYSTFNVAGKYDPNALAKKIYSYTVMGDADSLKTAVTETG